MRISWKNVSKYFEQELAHPDTYVELLSNSFCEIESITEGNGDFILDAKILPDRNDAKTEEGFAREIFAITGLPTKEGVAIVADSTHSRVNIEFSYERINTILGLNLSDAEIVEYFARVRVGVHDGKAYIPADRADLNVVEDLADEVMRLYGVNKISSVPLPAVTLTPPTTTFELAEKIRALLAEAGYTEFYAYSFAAQGEREVEKSLASDKSFLRTNLSDNLKEKLQKNLQYNLFEQDPIKMFEIGTVFLKDHEEIHLAVGIAYSKEKFKRETLPQWLGVGDQSVCEVPLDKALSAVASLEADITPFINLNTMYKPFSPYPRIIRDVALFAPNNVSTDEVATVIRESAGPLLVEGPVKFDEFSKEGEGRTSLAFRMAFQSHERSLTDEEANEALSGVILALEQHPNWQVRK